MKLFIINPGATSTKVAVFENETEIYSEKIAHSQEELSGFSSILEQLPMREKLVRGALERAGLTPRDLAAVCSRGGLLRHIESGTYEITDAVIQDVYHPPYGEHASSLGSVIARSIANEAGIPAYIVDPPSVGEGTCTLQVLPSIGPACTLARSPGGTRAMMLRSRCCDSWFRRNSCTNSGASWLACCTLMAWCRRCCIAPLSEAGRITDWLFAR